MKNSNRSYNVAVVGATGVVGETLLSILHERQFPCAKIYALASAQSVGKRVSFGKKNLTVKNLDEFDFNKVDVAFFSAGASVSEKYAPGAVDSGCVVIDNTSAFRYRDDVPLVVSEVNPEEVKKYETVGIIANPNCSTIQMLVALKPIHDIAEITRINVATYQAVSGTGKSGIEELAVQTESILNARSVPIRRLLEI